MRSLVELAYEYAVISWADVSTKLHDSNKDIIRKSVEELSKTETVPSVKSAISSVINKCAE